MAAFTRLDRWYPARRPGVVSVAATPPVVIVIDRAGDRVTRETDQL
jgi:hypothetical protein